MRNRFAAITLTIALIAAAAAATDIAPPNRVTERTKACRTATAKLGKGLKSELKAAMKAGGPVEALQVCNVQAVPIAEAISAEEGILVGRTSLRARNPKNTPDAWEAKVLRSFDAQKARGVASPNLEAWTVEADDEGHRTFRYMKAIPTASMCLKCHGAELEPEVSSALADLYPDDEAVGYEAGQLRGAFTVRMPLD